MPYQPDEPVKPGDRIMADDINEMRDALSNLSNINRGDNMEGYAGPMRMLRGLPARSTVMVRITADVYPEGSAEFVAAYGPFDTTLLPQDLFAAATTSIPNNAILQIYNPEANGAGGPTGWVDDPDSQKLYITSYATEPLAVNDRVPVYYDRSNNRWLPVFQILTNMVYVPSPGVLNMSGYQDGFILVFNSDTGVFIRGPQCHVADGNAIPVQ